MTTVNDVILDARAILDSYTENGTNIAESELADFIKSAIRFADMGQKELYAVGRAQKTVEVTNYPVRNLLGDTFDVEEFTGTDFYCPINGTANARSYHVIADSTHTVIIEELEGSVWQTLITLSGTSKTVYKGNITPTTTGNKIRFRFTGTTYYRYSNYALFEYSFVDNDSVPDYYAWIPYELPSDFKELETVIEEYYKEQYVLSSSYKFEQPNKLYYSYNFKGKLRIVYKPIPTTITSVSQVLQIDDITAKALSFYVASWLSPYENESLTNPLFQKFDELKRSMAKKEPKALEVITDVYGGI